MSSWFTIKDCTFIDFPQATSGANLGAAIKPCGACHHEFGGFQYRTSGLLFDNVGQRLQFGVPYESLVRDLDGSLIDLPGGGWAHGQLSTSRSASKDARVGYFPKDQCEVHNWLGKTLTGW